MRAHFVWQTLSVLFVLACGVAAHTKDVRLRVRLAAGGQDLMATFDRPHEPATAVGIAVNGFVIGRHAPHCEAASCTVTIPLETALRRSKDAAPSPRTCLSIHATVLAATTSKEAISMSTCYCIDFERPSHFYRPPWKPFDPDVIRAVPSFTTCVVPVGCDDNGALALRLQHALTAPPARILTGAVGTESEQAQLTAACTAVVDTMSEEQMVEAVPPCVPVSESERTASPDQGPRASSGRVVATLTTIPSRLTHVHHVLQALRNQTYSLDEIYLVLPSFSIREETQ